MATLHTVNKSPFQTRTLQSCLNHVSDGDTVLLIEDGVLGAARGTDVSDLVASSIGKITLCVLTPDLQARGIASERLLEGAQTVDYAGFVELAAKHDVTQAWL